MVNVIFRRATHCDVAATIALLADDPLGSVREDLSAGATGLYLDAFQTIDADPHQLLAVADADGVVSGCLQLTFIPGLSRKGMWRGQIEAVRIDRGLQGQGIGSQFLAWAIVQCRQRGCGLVQLTTDKTRAEAHRFYEKHGFVASHEGMKLAL